MKRTRYLLLTIALLVQFTFAIDLPPAPAGFVWQEIPELKAALLKPTDWYFRSETAKGTQAYFITKENIEKAGKFDTGLTVNVFRKLKKQVAFDHAARFMARCAEKDRQTRDIGPFLQANCKSEDTDATGTVVMYTLVMINQKTNTLYLFIFESPKADWETAWKTGEKIMDQLAVDDEI